MNFRELPQISEAEGRAFESRPVTISSLECVNGVWISGDISSSAEISSFPWPRVLERLPRVVTLAEQDAILQQIPGAERRLFLALSDPGL